MLIKTLLKVKAPGFLSNEAAWKAAFSCSPTNTWHRDNFHWEYLQLIFFDGYRFFAHLFLSNSASRALIWAAVNAVRGLFLRSMSSPTCRKPLLKLVNKKQIKSALSLSWISNLFIVTFSSFDVHFFHAHFLNYLWCSTQHYKKC